MLFICIHTCIHVHIHISIWHSYIHVCVEYLIWITQFRYFKIVSKKKKEGKRKFLLLSLSSMSVNNHCEHLTTDSPHSPIVSTNNYILIYLFKIYAKDIIFHAPFFPFMLSLNDMLETHSHQHTLSILISSWLHHILPGGCAIDLCNHNSQGPGFSAQLS